jgi:hypothetical protein
VIDGNGNEGTNFTGVVRPIAYIPLDQKGNIIEGNGIAVQENIKLVSGETVEIQDVLKSYGMTPSGLNFSGGYFPQIGRRVTFDVSDMTLKEILNKVIKESTIAKIWLIKKNRSDQTVLISVNSRNEDFPPKKFSISL